MRERHRPRPRPRIAASPLLGSPAAAGGRRSARNSEFGREAAPAAADLRWRVQSGLYFRGEGDSDSSAGRKNTNPPRKLEQRGEDVIQEHRA
ncbi:Forkhead box protein O1 [Manis javanica]|nr:Forkhead box protein O1 [Manis javanica]